MELFGNDRDVGHIPETVSKGALDLEARFFYIGKPFGGSFQGNVSRILVANPFITLPRLEQGIEIRRGKDEYAALFGHTPDLVDRFLRVGQMLHDMFDDDHVERAIFEGEFLRAGGL